jgi:hypothetical protein
MNNARMKRNYFYAGKNMIKTKEKFPFAEGSL